MLNQITNKTYKKYIDDKRKLQGVAQDITQIISLDKSHYKYGYQISIP